MIIHTNIQFTFLEGKLQFLVNNYSAQMPYAINEKDYTSRHKLSKIDVMDKLIKIRRK